VEDPKLINEVSEYCSFVCYLINIGSKIGVYPCGTRGRSTEFGNCSISIASTPGTSKVTSTCPEFTTIKYATALSGSATTPCTNVPVACELCVRADNLPLRCGDTTWKCTSETFILGIHKHLSFLTSSWNSASLHPRSKSQWEYHRNRFHQQFSHHWCRVRLRHLKLQMHVLEYPSAKHLKLFLPLKNPNSHVIQSNSYCNPNSLQLFSRITCSSSTRILLINFNKFRSIDTTINSDCITIFLTKV